MVQVQEGEQKPHSNVGLFCYNQFYGRFFLYILFFESFDKFYVGQTNTIEKRIWQHNNLEVDSFTSKYRPWKLVAQFNFPSREKAMKVERFIKKQKSRAFILKLIENSNNEEFIYDIFKDC